MDTVECVLKVCLIVNYSTLNLIENWDENEYKMENIDAKSLKLV